MSNGLSGIEEGGKDKEPSSVEVLDRSRSGSGCSFCWFVIKVYPNLGRMSSRDAVLFTEHLKKAHGLRDEILP